MKSSLLHLRLLSLFLILFSCCKSDFQPSPPNNEVPTPTVKKIQLLGAQTGELTPDFVTNYFGKLLRSDGPIGSAGAFDFTDSFYVGDEWILELHFYRLGPPRRADHILGAADLKYHGDQAGRQSFHWWDEKGFWTEP